MLNYNHVTPTYTFHGVSYSLHFTFMVELCLLTDLSEDYFGLHVFGPLHKPWINVAAVFHHSCATTRVSPDCSTHGSTPLSARARKHKTARVADADDEIKQLLLQLLLLLLLKCFA